MAFRQNTEQPVPWWHTLHCLNVLREEVICDASDIPRYTGYQPDQKSGMGQVRMCRDWKQLEAWSREHTACWKHIGNIYSDPNFNELDRYKFCPPESNYPATSKTGWLHQWKSVD